METFLRPFSQLQELTRQTARDVIPCDRWAHPQLSQQVLIRSDEAEVTDNEWLDAGIQASTGTGAMASERISGSRRMANMTSFLPQDVLSNIVELVEVGDYKTLLSCCFVSRDLLPSATKMLFRRVFITRLHFKSILTQLRTSLLKSFAVRHVHFDGIPGNPRHHLTSDEVTQVLSCLPSIEGLVIRGFKWKCSRSGVASIATLNKTSLTSLALDGALFVNEADVLDLVRTFPNLHKLVLYSVFLMKALDTPMESHCALPTLRILDAQWTSHNILRYMFPHDEVQNLEVVAFEATQWAGVPGWWDIFHKDQSYGNLRRLTVHIHTSSKHNTLHVCESLHIRLLMASYLEDRWVLLTLPNAPNLISLTLDNLVVTDRHVRRSLHDRIIKDALHQVTSSFVEELDFSFKEVMPNDLDFLNVSEWLECLSSLKFAHLQRVVYRFKGPALVKQQLYKIRENVIRAHESWTKRDIVEVIIEG